MRFDLSVFQYALLIALTIFGSSSQGSEEVEPQAVVRSFKTDLCTGYAEGSKTDPMLWAECCKKHDLDLWAGGAARARKKADSELFTCVKATGASRHAYLMLIGVKLGKLSLVKLPGKQWGNAWGDRVTRKRLTLEQIELLRDSLNHDSDLPAETIYPFIEGLILENEI